MGQAVGDIYSRFRVESGDCCQGELEIGLSQTYKWGLMTICNSSNSF